MKSALFLASALLGNLALGSVKTDRVFPDPQNEHPLQIKAKGDVYLGLRYIDVADAEGKPLITNPEVVDKRLIEEANKWDFYSSLPYTSTRARKSVNIGINALEIRKIKNLEDEDKLTLLWNVYHKPHDLEAGLNGDFTRLEPGKDGKFNGGEHYGGKFYGKQETKLTWSKMKDITDESAQGKGVFPRLLKWDDLRSELTKQKGKDFTNTPRDYVIVIRGFFTGNKREKPSFDNAANTWTNLPFFGLVTATFS